jgi:hypothetical protein
MAMTWLSLPEMNEMGMENAADNNTAAGLWLPRRKGSRRFTFTP